MLSPIGDTVVKVKEHDNGETTWADQVRVSSMSTHWAVTTVRRKASTMKHVLVADEVRNLGGILSRRWPAHHDKPWLAVIAVPLAMPVCALLGQWWAGAVLMVATVALSPHQRCRWLLALELAVIGTEWAYLGATALAERTNNMLHVESAWLAFPLALAAASAIHRHRKGQPALPH